MDEYGEQFTSSENQYPDFSDVPSRQLGRSEPRNFVPRRQQPAVVAAVRPAVKPAVTTAVTTAVTAASSPRELMTNQQYPTDPMYVFVWFVILFLCCYIVYGITNITREIIKLRKLIKLIGKSVIH